MRRAHRRRTAADALPSSRSRRHEFLGLLRFPTLVTLLLTMPAVLVGPLAFAIREDFAFSPTDIGNAYAAFFLMSALFAMFGSRPARRLGAVRLMRFGLLGQSAVFVIGALGQHALALYAVTTLGGAIFGLTMVGVNLAIMTTVPAHRRGLAFGLRTASLPTAATLVGAAASLVATGQLHWRSVFWIAAALTALISLTVRSSSVDPTRQDTAERHDVQGGRGTYRALLLGGSLGSIAISPLPGFMVESLIASGQSPAVAGAILAIAGWSGLLMRVGLGGVADQLSDARTHLRLIGALLLILVPSAVCLALVHDVAALTVAAVMALGFGYAWPGLLFFATMNTHRERAAQVASKLQAWQNLGAVTGAFAFGLVAGRFSFVPAWLVTAAIAAVAASVILLAEAALTRRRSSAEDRSG